jgi:hypothetical protein
VVFAVQGANDPLLFCRRQFRENRCTLDRICRGLIRHPFDLRPKQDLPGIETHLAAYLPGNDVIIPGQYLDFYASRGQRGNCCAGAFLGRIEKGYIAKQRQLALVRFRVDFLQQLHRGSASSVLPVSPGRFTAAVVFTIARRRAAASLDRCSCRKAVPVASSTIATITMAARVSPRRPETIAGSAAAH